MSWILRYIYNLFIGFFSKENKENCFVDKKQLVENKLNEWKVNLFASNKYLFFIPEKQIIKKRKEFESELINSD